MTRSPTRQQSWAARRVALGHAAVWLAVFCVYVQLLAAALCPVGSVGAALGPGAFPICHAAAEGVDHRSRDGQTPLPDDHCPFCAIHCHTTAALTATSIAPAPLALAFAAVERPSFSVPAAPRRIAGGSPRGPPAAAWA